MISADGYKRALRRFASGLTVVTVAAQDRFHGMTASSFASVSLEPPLVLVSLAHSSVTHGLVLESGSFAVNVLAEGQDAIARAFAQRGDKPFDSMAHRVGANGSPLLDGAIGWLECSTESVVPAGDHDIVVALVTEAETSPGSPLVYFEGDYRSLKDS